MLDEINQIAMQLDGMKVDKLKRVTSMGGDEASLKHSQQF